MLRSALVMFVLLLVGVVGPAHATTLDFNAYEQPGSGFIIHPHPLDVAGYRFTSVDYSSTPLLTTFQQSSSFYNGSAALGCGNGSDLVLTRIDGAEFDAVSVSLDSWPGAGAIEITGEQSGGGNVQQVFTTDSIVGPEPVVLVGFTGLTSLRFDAAGAGSFAGIFGQVDSLVVALAQNQPPVADAGEDQIIVPTDSADLSGSATDPDGDSITQWEWAVISAPVGSAYQLVDPYTPTPSFSTDTLGNYVVTLRVFDGGLWSDLDAMLIVVVENLLPTAVLSASPTVGLVPLTVAFDSAGSFDPDGLPLTYQWFFGDGGVSTAPATSHEYIDPGIFTAQLHVTDNFGNVDYATTEITVTAPNTDPPAADAGRDQYMLLEWSLTLQGTSSDPNLDPIVIWEWQVVLAPEGSAYSLADADSPSPTFSTDTLGDYAINLRVFDGLFWSSFDQVIVRAVETLPPNQPPIADAGPYQYIFLSETAQLDGSATDPDGDPIFDWDWEVISAPRDSVYSILGASSPDALFTTDTAGDYVLTLRASDGFLWSDPDAMLVVVTVNQSPTAAAAATPTSGPAPLIVQFDGSGSTDPEGGDLLYDWDFGDGEYGTGASTIHIYTDPGIYAVFLIVTDDRGNDDFDTVEITVTEPPLVPALSPLGIAVLVLLLMGSAAFMLRRVRGEPH